jgi:nucleotide-binding universal stress UspA family protein
MGINASCLFKESSPADAIMAVARRSQPDLIILSRKPRGRLGKWFGRRTVERVVRSSACPVLVLPESC